MVRHELVLDSLEDDGPGLLDRQVGQSHDFERFHDDRVVDGAILKVVLLPDVEPYVVVGIVFLRFILLVYLDV